MLGLHSDNKFELYLPATDMRKSFDSLCGLIKGELSHIPTDGSVYIFVNKLHNKMKLLQWRSGGFVLYYKRLEEGTFDVPIYDDNVKSLGLSYPQLVLLIDGIAITHIDRKKRYDLTI